MICLVKNELKYFYLIIQCIKNAQITAMLYGNIIVMAIHFFNLNFSISREVPLNSGRCHGFIGVFLHLCSEQTALNSDVFIVSIQLSKYN